jgi:hypothetical protein
MATIIRGMFSSIHLKKISIWACVFAAAKSAAARGS